MLIANRVIQDTPESIANFIITHRKDLDKVQLGECLGDGDNRQIQMLNIFMEDGYEFEGMNIPDALRNLLEEDFRLPGESQKVSRVMNTFANSYFKANKDNPRTDFKNPDAIFILAFACIQLNTDAYNPNVPKKMTLQQFIHNARGMNAGSDFDPKFLKQLYMDITTKEIKMKGEQPEPSTDKKLGKPGPR